MSSTRSAVDRSAELALVRRQAIAELTEANEAREQGLAACRQVIRACSRSIRLVHRHEFDEALLVAREAEDSLRLAQQKLVPHPKIAHAGFLHDAEKEYAEALLTIALVRRETLPHASQIGVETVAWLNGLAEAASELRRYLLDRLRAGEFDDGDRLLEDMDDVYELLISLDFPDAITGGLRRTTDAFRAVLERTRSDYTTTTMQERLRAAIEKHSLMTEVRSGE